MIAHANPPLNSLPRQSGPFWAGRVCIFLLLLGLAWFGYGATERYMAGQQCMNKAMHFNIGGDTLGSITKEAGLECTYDNYGVNRGCRIYCYNKGGERLSWYLGPEGGLQVGTGLTEALTPDLPRARAFDLSK